MLDILEKFVKLKNFTYHRMDGNTAIKGRMSIVDSFNNNPVLLSNLEIELFQRTFFYSY